MLTYLFHRLLIGLLSSMPIIISAQWNYYGGNAGGTRFSTQVDINPDNVSHLKLAWQFQTGEMDKYGDNEYIMNRAAFEATPIQIGDRIFFSTPTNTIFCLEVSSGELVWRFDPDIDIQQTEYSEVTNRGVAYWKGERQGNKIERILFGTIDGRLFSIDAQSGKADYSFGRAGWVDLKNGLGRVQVTSAPVIWDHYVITGSSMGDNGYVHMPRGVVRAFDIFSGKQVWDWDPLDCQGDVVLGGAANAWSTLSMDLDSGIVYIPTSSPSPDFFGGLRPGDNGCANSLVALRASTGEYLWHFQVVRHDLWDYDIAAQPVLFQFRDSVPAVAIGTKMGHIFVLNRYSGQPLLPIQERAVPTSKLPDEVAAPRQIFPVSPPPLGLQQINEYDLWGPNPKEMEISQKRFDELTYQGKFTPPDIGFGTLILPGNIGGIHWGGMTIDTEQEILVVNINNMGHIVSLKERHDLAAFDEFHSAVRNDQNQIDPDYTSMMGAPYFMSRSIFAKATKEGAFWVQTKPPWGELIGIHISDGSIAWQRPLGVMLQPDQFPEAEDWGCLNLGGAITTDTDLTFVAATFDQYLRAFRTSTGELLWEYELPFAGIATPMLATLEGKQFLIIAAGGHGKVDFLNRGDLLLAFSLVK